MRRNCKIFVQVLDFLCGLLYNRENNFIYPEETSMLFVIENDLLKVSVDSCGCEIVSIVGKKDDTEYVWGGNTEFWAQHAPTMFPICGRLQDGKYTYRGKTYEMNLHGFARHAEFTIAEKTPTSISMTLTDNEAIYATYPFHFAFTITHTLDGETVRTDYKVENKSDVPMPYAVGGHPGYNLPLGGKGSFTDCYIEFDTVAPVRKLVLTERCLMTEDTVEFPLIDGTKLDLHHGLFDNDAIFLVDMAKGVTLKSKVSDKFVAMKYDDMKYLGLWHKPLTEAPYMCIEPWTSVPAYDGKVDDLETKRDLAHLGAGETAYLGYSITIGQ